MTAGGEAKVRVAVVDDSTFIRKAILRMLRDEPAIEVVGSAGSGEELLTHFERWRPDVVTLDLDMPGMGGLATLDHVRGMGSTPVIILSTHSGEGAPLTIEALHRGATDFIDKQRYSLVDFEALRAVLVEKIFHVTGRDPSKRPAAAPAAAPPDDGGSRQAAASAPTLAQGSAEARSARSPGSPTPGAFDLVVIGASTGGPPILQVLLEDLGDSVPVPIVVVQHMPVGFTSAFAERLNAYLPLQVREAQPSERLLPDTVYIASAGSHLRIRRHKGRLFTELSSHPQNLMHVPSIDVLFESAAREVGERAIGVLLTGMGRDGARGMAALRRQGGYTLCQDEDSCVVFGMPRAALALNAVIEIAAPQKLARRLVHLINRAGREGSGGSSPSPR